MIKKLKEIDLTQKNKQQYLVGILLCGIGLWMTVLNYMTGHQMLAFINALLGIMGGICACIARNKKEKTGISCLIFGGLYSLCMGYLISGVIDGFATAWFYILPLFAYILFELKVGFFLNFLVWVSVCTVLWMPMPICLRGYSISFYRRFPIVFGAAILVSTLLEWIRLQAMEKLRKSQAETEHAAIIDTVTDAYTYYGLDKQIQKERKTSGTVPAAIVAADIKNFKMINDLYGYSYGNQILKKITDSLKEELNEHEYIARVESDHFLLVLDKTPRSQLRECIEHYMEKIYNLNAELGIQMYFGIVITNNMSQSLEKLYTEALLAKDATRRKGRCGLEFFEKKQKEEILWEKKLDADLKRAMKHEEFVTYLQPKYHLKHKCYCGAEALVRWKKPDGSMVSPNTFIPYMEKNGMITQVDFIILEEVCKMQMAWKKEGRMLYPISVNMSRAHLFTPNFAQRLAKIIWQHGLPTTAVEIELTESMMDGGALQFADFAQDLHKVGIRLHMDDFGSGYSSFGLLKDISVDVVKLDKSLFDGEMSDEKNRRVISGLISLCHALEHEVVAEGIETEQQVHQLTQMGCDIIQGYYYGRPMERIQYERILYRTSAGKTV
ncbi:MAG: bifunctional diguanylate cyclase/phosphodiesterase [Lachnospiraceae bacterium]|nr:bifunctional diguanylate cyclase/phosphodiesterase [Lachnospiraceae bacterium]